MATLTIMGERVGVDETLLSEIVRRVLSVTRPERIILFGSAASGLMTKDSDIDLLVDFLPDARPGLLGLSAMGRELSALLGRHVDLAVKPALKPLIRPGVRAEALRIYAA